MKKLEIQQSVQLGMASETQSHGPNAMIRHPRTTAVAIPSQDAFDVRVLEHVKIFWFEMLLDQGGSPTCIFPDATHVTAIYADQLTPLAPPLA